MQTFTASQANTVFFDVVAKASGAPIVAGTVNFYLIATDGDNAGKWFRASDSSWQVAEASAGAATYKGGAQWQLSIAAAAWLNGVSYTLYAKESGDLNIIYTDEIVSLTVAMLYESGSGGTCPVDLTEMKLHLRVDSTDDDTLIAQLMLAATDWAENYQCRTYITRTRYLYLDDFHLIIHPPYSPLVAVTSIQYYDTAGALQTLDAAYYTVDNKNEPGRIVEAYNYSWPSTYDILNAVIITYTSGYGEAADVPEDIKAAIKLLVTHLYIDRGGLDDIPQSVQALLSMKRVYNL